MGSIREWISLVAKRGSYARSLRLIVGGHDYEGEI
jgi:hypothetical protein